MAVQMKIDKDCTLSRWDWELYFILFHPENKINSLEELRSYTVEQVHDYREALDSISLLKTAIHKDAEMEEKLRSGK